MKKNKIKTYFLELLLLVILFFALLVSNKITYIKLAIILSIYAVIVKAVLKKKKILSIYKKQVTLLMIAFAIIYLCVFYLMGVFINDFSKEPILFGVKTVYRYIIPLSLIIISSEVIRYAFITQETKIRIKKEILIFLKLLHL